MKHQSIRRFIIATIVGAVAGLVVGTTLDWLYAPLAGWDVFVLALLLQIIRDFAHDTPDETAKSAREDAMNHRIVDTIVLITSVASLGAVIMLLGRKDSGTAHIVFCLVSILLSWVMVHTLFTLRYATLYYRGNEGGIDFNNPSQQRPSILDFAYLAFTIGMTYQVSDMVIKDQRIRRVILLQALISFVFGVVIIASTINFIIGFAA